MHNGSYAAHESGFGTRRGRGRARRSGRFFGLDVERIGPRARIAAALAMLIPVALSGLLLVAFAPGLWWIFTTYFWVAFPSLRLLTQGAAGFSGRKPQRKTFARFGGERELLEALRREGELTPTRAAIGTSLSVAEADGMLKGLAEAGHLEARVRGGALFYALWETAEGARTIERRPLSEQGGSS